MRLLVFAGLAAVVALRWSALVESPPAGRILLVIGICAAGAAALEAVGRVRARPAARWALAAAVAVAIVGAALLAAGVPARLLVPTGWGELGDRLHDGIRELGDADYPYHGREEWSRIALLSALAGILAIAAILAGWPRRDGAGRMRVVALAVLLGGYVAAVAIGGQGDPLWAGLGLLALVAAWLWLPRVAARRRTVAIAAVAAAGLVAVPAAAALDSDEPWVNYENWTWGPLHDAISYDWNHRYGPLDWPRDGTTLFEVESDTPHYWRATVLDNFDGTAWHRSAEAVDSMEIPSEVEGKAAEDNARWSPKVTVTLGALRSAYVVAPGYVRQLTGLAYQPVGDGTTLTDGLAEPGDQYDVRGYEPDPDREQLRRARAPYAGGLARYTRLELADRLLATSDPLDEGSSLALTRPIRIPLRDGPEASLRAGSRTAIRRAGYARVYNLARSLTDGARTPYVAVRAIERYLSRDFAYSEDPPVRDVPLRGFLLRDRVGYCQHFSGAMALLLRMAGIPARVASGFSPGTPAGGTYEVTDLDAHSWVEVYFMGIGWVPFDPTPGIAPATSQAGPGDFTAAPSRGVLPQRRPKGVGPQPTATSAGSGDSESGDSGRVIAGVLLGLGALGAVAAGVATVRRRRAFLALEPPQALAAQADEIHRALPRAGQRVPPGATLRAMERRLKRSGKPRAAAYVAKLAGARYARDTEAGPTLSERRRVRRELRGGRSARDRLRSLGAMPPGGPRPV
jgi:transglutaminase-like putative cysteine protease